MSKLGEDKCIYSFFLTQALIIARSFMY